MTQLLQEFRLAETSPKSSFVTEMNRMPWQQQIRNGDKMYDKNPVKKGWVGYLTSDFLRFEFARRCRRLYPQRAGNMDRRTFEKCRREEFLSRTA